MCDAYHPDVVPLQTEAIPLRARGLTKSFHGHTVLADVDLDLRAGQVHGLVGENGAGKSTLMKVLAGVHTADAGTGERGRTLGHGAA